ncbi:molybdenum cofactor guanylyltransferase [Moraxella ovis]|uniref:molybdenum cofactor guanylyltransferase n=1 Tax=Moraxella ovis TaxID=29433 RepID=UPI000D955C02|nr:NTP transferase domain-containing protein [Moraxella ovis]SPX83877.1 molybdopterin-guanine dinucleotide biosynthesis protein MobA [Moraxella ovis]STZ06418.1 molybdopterin-guanine dinucleotide biosynthesis protein MobA [Moraxella ovis]
MSVIGLLILAGGNSRRMGSPKALLPLPTHQTLLDFHINNAKTLNLPILLGDNDKNFLDKGFLKNTNSINSSVVIIDDYIKNAGALSCLLSAFHYCQSHLINHQDELKNKNLSDNFLMVISCDNLIDVGEIFNLLKKADLKNHHGAYLKDISGDKDYPLLGCYSLSLYDELKIYLDKGERSVMKFLKNKTIYQTRMPTDWQNLANFNTPDEFRLALSYFKNNPQKEQS